MPYNEPVTNAIIESTAIKSTKDAKEGPITADQVSDLILTFYKDRYGFFTPYKSGYDFVETLASPVVVPAVLGVGSGLFFVGSVIAGFVSLGALGVAVGAAIFEDDDLLISCTGILNMSAFITGITALVGAALAFAAVLSIPYTLVELITRTASTIISPIIDACCPDELDEVEPSLVNYPTY